MLADRVRVRIDGAAPVIAEITVAAAKDLDVQPGSELWSVVKATDVKVYPA